jgi:hypothetical protein
MFQLKDTALLERLPRFFREWHAGNEGHVDVFSGELNGFAGDSSTCAVATMALKQPQARGLNHAGGLCAPVRMHKKLTIRGIDDVGWTFLAHLKCESRE